MLILNSDLEFFETVNTTTHTRDIVKEIVSAVNKKSGNGYLGLETKTRLI